ncbi:MAG: threonine--tRNA ligase, partial [Pseudomonadota bacterium]
EGALEAAIKAAGAPYKIDPGEGAFYGPKLDFKLTDAIGREWQCGTFQADFVLPERLGAEYVTTAGDKAVPVMLHRAILGSFERFLGILIENHAGRMPFWMTPRQIVVATITSEADGYAQEVVAALTKAGLRTEADTRNEKINYKVREHSLAKVPAILAVGAKEVEGRTVAIRRLGDKGQSFTPLDEAVAAFADEALAPDLKREAG